MRVGLLAASGLILLLAILKPLSMDVAFAAAFLYQIYVPMCLGYVAQFDRTALKTDLWRTLWVLLLTFPLFFLGYYCLLTSYGAHFSPVFSWSLLTGVLINGFMIALPEEIFYRGFLQGRLAILIVNALFALGHFVGEYDVSRLLPFFPGLVFSWLVFKGRGSLTGAVIYHTLCNVYAEWLAASWTTSHY